MQLIRQLDLPAAARTAYGARVRVVWPLSSLVVTAREYPNTAAAIVTMFSSSAVALAAIKAQRRPPL